MNNIPPISSYPALAILAIMDLAIIFILLLKSILPPKEVTDAIAKNGLVVTDKGAYTKGG